MKTYLSLFAGAMLMLMSSCSNDDIKISRGVNFTVNPATVLDDFTSIEFNAGELESFSTSYRLRVRLYVYNKQGDLVDSLFENSFTNYAVKMRGSMFLENGDYTAIAISDIYRPKTSSLDYREYWVVTGQKSLSTLKISDAGWISGERGIFGLAAKNITVTDSGVDVNIDLKPAGALMLVWYRNFKTFPEVEYYQLGVNKLQESITFNQYGETSVNMKNNNNSYDWRISLLELEDYATSSYTGIYDYCYLFPMKNLGTRIEYGVGDTQYFMSGTENTINLEPGDTYYFILNLKDEDANDGITYNWGKANSANARSGILQELRPAENGQMDMMRDVKRSNDSRQEAFVKDLI